MTTLTISLSDEQWLKLKKVAEQLGVSPEPLVQSNVEELLIKSEEAFKQAADYVLNKKTELYRRLA